MKILIIWDYTREDLTSHLLEMSNEIDFVFLHFYKKNNLNPEIDRIFWSDFDSPYKIIRKVKPDKIVFCDIESFHQLALNIAAKNLKIKTYVLQHGLRTQSEVENELMRKSNFNYSVKSTSFQTLLFLLKALKIKNVPNLFELLKIMYNRKFNELTVGLYKCHSSFRNADIYIEFSKSNLGYYKKRDGVLDNQFILVGNPYFDRYFSNLKEMKTQNYFLLIDCPFLEADFISKNRMSLSEKNKYIVQINNYAKLNNKKLYIKLHPLSYNSSNLLLDENIKYFKNCDLYELIANADLCINVHLSTLTPLILYSKKFITFKTKYFDTYDLFEELQIKMYDLENFVIEDLECLELDKKQLNYLKDSYLFETDGNSNQRIKNILLQ